MPQLPAGRGMRPLCPSIAVSFCLCGDVRTNAQGTASQPSGPTVVAVKGWMFTINGQPTCTAASGLFDADWNVQEFVEARPEWRQAGPLAFTANFFIDGEPFSYKRNAPFVLGNREWWDPHELTPGAHTLRVVAYDLRGPRFTETCAIEEFPFTVGPVQ